MTSIKDPYVKSIEWAKHLRKWGKNQDNKLKNYNMTNDKLYTQNTIKTVSGLYINVFDPDPETIDINDIAHSLSQTARWGGHLKHFFSVAQHSINVCKNLPPKFQLEGLLHDATEAYLGDMPKPIKKGLNTYNEVEKNLDAVIRRKFNLPSEMSIEVKSMDKEALEWEWHNLREKELNFYQDMSTMKQAFLNLFYSLQ